MQDTRFVQSLCNSISSESYSLMAGVIKNFQTYVINLGAGGNQELHQRDWETFKILNLALLIA